MIFILIQGSKINQNSSYQYFCPRIKWCAYVLFCNDRLPLDGKLNMSLSWESRIGSEFVLIWHTLIRTQWLNAQCEKAGVVKNHIQVTHLGIWVVSMWSESHSVMSDSLWPHGLCSSWNSPGHNTGVGSLSLLQGIFPTQGLNPGLPHCRQILYQLSHQENPGWLL